MTPAQVRRRRATLERRRDKYVAEYTALRKACGHPNVAREAKSNTGNWCPQDDRYWEEFNCPDCGHFWSEDR